jgi:hypothetical protein
MPYEKDRIGRTVYVEPAKVRAREERQTKKAAARDLAAQVKAAIVAAELPISQLEEIKPGDWGYLWPGQRRQTDGYSVRYTERYGVRVHHNGGERGENYNILAMKALIAAGFDADLDNAWSGWCVRVRGRKSQEA